MVGDGLEQGTQLGPIQNKTQYERVMGLIESARKDGKIIAGGERQGDKGYFIKPTIVRDITDGSRLVDEEQFGPVLPVIRYSRRRGRAGAANNTEYGLGGSIWSPDLDKAYDLATRMESRHGVGEQARRPRPQHPVRRRQGLRHRRGAGRRGPRRVHPAAGDQSLMRGGERS